MTLEIFAYILIYSIGLVAILWSGRRIGTNYITERRQLSAEEWSVQKFLARHQNLIGVFIAFFIPFALHATDSFRSWSKGKAETQRAMDIVIADTKTILENAWVYQSSISLWENGCTAHDLRQVIEDTNFVTGISSNFGEEILMSLPDEFLSVIRKYDTAFESAGYSAMMANIAGGRTEKAQKLIEIGLDYYRAQKSVVDGKDLSKREALEQIVRANQATVTALASVCASP